MRTLSIIIPAYNEERTIHMILDKVRNVELMNGVAKDVVIVNDGSTDGTVTAVERYITVHPGMGMDAHPQTESSASTTTRARCSARGPSPVPC